MTALLPVPSVVDALARPDDAAWAVASCPPGPEAVAVLAVLRPERLSAAGRVDALRGYERQIAALQAAQLRLVAAMAAADRSPEQWGREDVACALRVPPATAAARLHTAQALTTRLPATLALLAAGEISLRHAQLLADEVTTVSDDVATAVQARVLGRAGGQTVAQFRRSVRRAVAALDHAGAEERHQDAVADRRVVVTPIEDGMAILWALLPAPEAFAVKAALDARATHTAAADRAAGGRPAGPDAAAEPCAAGAPDTDTDTDARPTGTCGGDSGASAEPCAADTGRAATHPDGDPPAGGPPAGGWRTMDQRRADALVEFAFCALSDPHLPTRHGLRPAIGVTVAASTLLGLDDEPAHLDGAGPLPAFLARRVAADPTGTWRRLLTDPETGQLRDYGTTRYRPPAALAAFVITRDGVCAFPGCHRSAWACDLDHRLSADRGGPTTPANLHPLCRRHHLAKHHTAWHPQRHPDGTTTWTSPTGHTYRTHPPDHLPRDRTADDWSQRPSATASPGAPPDAAPPTTDDPPPF